MPSADVPAPLRPPRAGAGDRRVIGVVVGVQLTASLGFYAVMAHVVAHLRDDVGLLAGTIGFVLGTRLLVQYALLLPFGALVDAIGAARGGVLACALRAAGFAVLAVAGGVPALLAASVLLGAGGAFFHPVAQSLLAGTSPAVRARGYAAYAFTGQLAMVAAPPIGLAVVAGAFALDGGGGGSGGGGDGDLFGPFGVLGAPDGRFALLAGGAAVAWAIAAALFLLLDGAPAAQANGASGGTRARRGRAAAREVADGVRDAVRDRAFLRFTAATCAGPLLSDQATTVVPLRGGGSGGTTLFLCVAGLVAALIQPWCAARDRAARDGVVPAGFLVAGSSYAALIPLGAGGAPPLAGLLAAALLSGIGMGLLMPSVFQQLVRHAPPGRTGAYFGVRAFLAGIVSFGGGLAVGRLFQFGPGGGAAALAGLALLSFASAAACAVKDRKGRTARSAQAAPFRNDAAIGAAAPAPVPPPSTITANARSPR